jgi:hypothetical protein
LQEVPRNLANTTTPQNTTHISFQDCIRKRKKGKEEEEEITYRLSVVDHRGFNWTRTPRPSDWIIPLS